MWLIPSFAVIPVAGNPFAALSLPELFAVGAMLAFGVLVLLVARLTNEGRTLWVARCPDDGRRLRVVVQPVHRRIRTMPPTRQATPNRREALAGVTRIPHRP